MPFETNKNVMDMFKNTGYVKTTARFSLQNACSNTMISFFIKNI